MPLDTNIALGVQPLKLDNPMNAMIGLSQLEHAKNQNALAQYQISSAQRADQSQNALNDAYRGSIDTSTGKIDYPKLYANLASGGAAQHIPTVIAQQNLARKNDTEEASHRAKLIVDKTAAYRDIVGSIKSKDDAIKWLQMQINDPDMAGSPVTKLSLADMSNKIPDDPAQLSNWKNQMGLGMTKFITENKPTLTSQNLGGTARVLTTPGLGGTSSVVPGSESAVSMTPGDVARLAQSKDQFTQTQGLAREKFTWEKANPGYELKENDKGEIVGVNKKTLQSFPVTIGNPQQNTAPSSAAPMASGAAAPVAGAPGSPLIGKGTALTDSQGNAAAYGMRMREANDLMNKLESSGTKNTGIIKNTIGSVVGVFPFIGDKLTEGVGSMMNPLPGLLGGPNSEQQQLDAARRNFVTAVLRKESGAAISPSEFANEEKKYFPQVGDTDAVLKQKQKSRELAIKAMSIQAGPGAKYIPGAQGSMSGSDPLGLFK